MEDLDLFEWTILLICSVISIIALVKYFRLCKDVRRIRSIVEYNWGPRPESKTTSQQTTKGIISPTKSDVREFHERINEYKKLHKVVDQGWLDNLIEEYNNRFNEDFSQYL